MTKKGVTKVYGELDFGLRKVRLSYYESQTLGYGKSKGPEMHEKRAVIVAQVLGKFC